MRLQSNDFDFRRAAAFVMPPPYAAGFIIRQEQFPKQAAITNCLMFSKGGGYTTNCQTCVIANELRRRGFDVSAQENTGKGSAPYDLSFKTEKAWLDKDGNTPRKQKAGGYFYDASLSKNRMKTVQEMTRDMNDLTKAEGRYHIEYFQNREYGGGGHIVTLERMPNGDMRIYDPQNGIIEIWGNLSQKINKGKGVRVLRA